MGRSSVIWDSDNDDDSIDALSLSHRCGRDDVVIRSGAPNVDRLLRHGGLLTGTLTEVIGPGKTQVGDYEHTCVPPRYVNF
jgi:RecA/RadA recombinase